MTCKDCLHFAVCKDATVPNPEYKGVQPDKSKECRHFKNKSDFAEVKHGTWVKEKEYEDGKIDYKCSVCDYDDTFTETTIVFHKYCNYCGAKMDGKGDK